MIELEPWNLIELPNEILWYIADFLPYNDQISLIFTCKELFECLDFKQYNFLVEKEFLGQNLYNHQMIVISRIFQTIPKEPYYELIDDNCIGFEPESLSIIAKVGFGKTRIGIRAALQYFKTYQVIIAVPNQQVMTVWINEITKLGLYNSKPEYCDFLVASSNRKNHYSYWRNWTNDEHKIILVTIRTCYKKNFNKPVLFIKDEAHSFEMVKLGNSSYPNHSVVNLTATHIDQFRYRKRKQNIYIYNNPWNRPKITYNQIDKFDMDFVRKLENGKKRPIVFVSKKDLSSMRNKLNYRFNFWIGNGKQTFKKYNSSNILTVVSTDVVEGVNFNLSNVIGFNCSLNNIRLGRIVQILGRVIRNSNKSKSFEVFNFKHNNRDIIKIRIAIYLLQNEIKENDPDLTSTDHIDLLVKRIKKLGYSLLDLTGKELLWLFCDTDLRWDFKNFSKESVLGMKNLLNLGFAKR